MFVVLSIQKNNFMYDYKTHGDFKKYYDSEFKRNYWVLGYFGGGAINIVETYILSVEFAKAINVPLTSIHIDEVLHSRRFKHFKYLYSTEENQKPESDSNVTENVMSWLCD